MTPDHILGFIVGMIAATVIFMAYSRSDVAWVTRSPKEDPFEDLKTHRRIWRNALEGMRDTAPPSAEDFDDRGFWEHEIRAFDRTFDALLN